MKNNKGITLIALVITIIVMLILLVVTIRVAQNGNLFTYASNAVKETRRAQGEEQTILNGVFTIGSTTYNSIDDYVIGETLIPLYGDANDDKTISILDVPAMSSYISGENVPTDQQRINSDVNLDGVIDAKDRSVLLAYISNEIPGLPYTGELPSDE